MGSLLNTKVPSNSALKRTKPEPKANSTGTMQPSADNQYKKNKKIVFGRKSAEEHEHALHVAKTLKQKRDSFSAFEQSIFHPIERSSKRK